MRTLLWLFATIAFIPHNIFGQGISRGQFQQALPLYYDARTGNVTIDTTEVFLGTMSGYSWQVPCGDVCDAFLAERHTPFMDSFFTTSMGDLVGETNITGIPGGVYSLGEILPAGLPEDDFLSTYFSVDEFPDSVFSKTKYYVLSEAGSNVQHLLQPIYSPSPFSADNDADVRGSVASIDRWATAANLQYDTRTGELILDTSKENGGAIFSYEIQFTSPVIDVTKFISAHKEGSGIATATDSHLLEVGWNGISSDTYSLGPILSPGLSVLELTSLIESAEFLGEPGHSVASLDVATNGIGMSLSLVPEPTCRTILLILILLSGVPRRNVR